MTHFLLDTSTLSHLLRRDARVLARLERLDAPDAVWTCTITTGEVLYGLERMPRGRKRDKLAQDISRLLARLPCQSIPPSAAGTYARIKADAERRGNRLAENDLWLAATALALEYVLVSADSDFERVGCGLRIENWGR